MAIMAYEFIETPEVNTNLWSSTPIMIVPGCTYHMSFDIKRDPSDTDTNYCYVALNPLDDNKNFIDSTLYFRFSLTFKRSHSTIFSQRFGGGINEEKKNT